MSVNLSSTQFRSGDLEKTILGALAAANIAPERLDLEITELTRLEDRGDTRRTLDALRVQGLRISLDLIEGVETAKQLRMIDNRRSAGLLLQPARPGIGSQRTSPARLSRSGGLAERRCRIARSPRPEQCSVLPAIASFQRVKCISLSRDSISTEQQLEHVRYAP